MRLGSWCFILESYNPTAADRLPASYADELEGELMGELENARLVRLMCKFGFINERPESVTGGESMFAHCLTLLFCFRFHHDPRWSETGDRYIIGLFRDYVFHQVDEYGNPVVNLTHVLTCLNKVCPRLLFFGCKGLNACAAAGCWCR